MPSSGLRGHHACMWCTHTHPCRQDTQINLKAPSSVCLGSLWYCGSQKPSALLRRSQVACRVGTELPFSPQALRALCCLSVRPHCRTPVLGPKGTCRDHPVQEPWHQESPVSYASLPAPPGAPPGAHQSQSCAHSWAISPPSLLIKL